MESCSMSSGFIQVAETADLISMVLFMNNEKGYIVQWVEGRRAGSLSSICE